MRWTILALALWSGAAAAEQATYVFEWQGANGYRIEGMMAFDKQLAEAPVVWAENVTCFVIEGFVGAEKIGRWALSEKTEETTWVLTFLPRESAFAHHTAWLSMPQGWNMNGAGTDCGSGGFGFNLGNLGQDICLSNELHRASRVHPQTPLPARRDDAAVLPADACAGVIPTS